MNLTATTFADYAAARAYLEPFAHLPGRTTPQEALQRAQALMTALGDPQNRVPVIHLAGTSGKGSTATILAAILHAHGQRVGLGLSPHVRHLLERVQVDGTPISEAEFCRVLGTMVPAITAMQQSEWGAPSFFEILIALSYQLFAEEGVDVVVMETGLGGRFDATNTVTRRDKIALFTSIDFDHTDLLGTTLDKIAAQKAGIIQPGNRVLTYLQSTDAQRVIEAECAAQEAQLTLFDPELALHAIALYPTHVTFDLTLPEGKQLRGLHLALTGAHQAENAGLAITAAQLFLRGMGRDLDERGLRHALTQLTLPGRMDQRTWRDVRIIIDGAHNPQKMHALMDALTALYPGQRFIFVVALKQGKDHKTILAQLLPLAVHLVLTRFDNQEQGMPLQAADPIELAAQVSRAAAVPISVVPELATALDFAVKLARTLIPPPPIVVTGSLYALAEAYRTLENEARPADDIE